MKFTRIIERTKIPAFSSLVNFIIVVVAVVVAGNAATADSVGYDSSEAESFLEGTSLSSQYLWPSELSSETDECKIFEYAKKGDRRCGIFAENNLFDLVCILQVISRLFNIFMAGILEDAVE
mmetsp:Transcript_38715/g.58136  ORF Transcript_38715/g.58136 Transcript_38715/m.58136 type:complete len:122 (-) Transcript_38715:204-569(-)